MIRTLVTKARSQNQKTGPVDLATYRVQDSCPADCAARIAAVCYAADRMGRPSAFDTAERGTILEDDYGLLVDRLGALRSGATVRFNVAGDYLLADGSPDLAYIEATNATPADVTVLSYTHAWRSLSVDLFAPHTRPNASVDRVDDIGPAIAAGWAPVMIDPDGRYDGATLRGRPCVICPYATAGVQCTRCKLCARTDRKSIVVFPQHGSAGRGKAGRARMLDAIGESL